MTTLVRSRSCPILFQAALIILTLLFLAPLFSLLPEAVLGAIIIQAVVMGMMNVSEMRRIYTVKRGEFLIALLALLVSLPLGSWRGWQSACSFP